MGWITKALCAAAVLAAAPASAQVVLTGNYIKVGIGARGTLGVGGTTSPGLIHDPTGMGNFNPATDYITPGSPHEGFSVNSVQTGFVQNDNNGPFGVSTLSAVALLTGAAANGYANAASWTGGNSLFTIKNSYFFNANDERILVTTTITALSALTNVAFGRSVDPDSAGAGDPTINQRGNSLFGLDDFVGSASAVNGRTLALVNLNGNALTHTTQINSDCCSNINPYNVLAHSGGDLGNASTGDHGLNLAYSLGNLASGSSITFNYAYAVGTRIDVVGGDGGAVPEPATWAMMIAGFGLVGGSLRRRSAALTMALQA